MCMADTGCQSCVASIKVISRLGIKRQEFIPVTMKMHAANKHCINILGAAILRFSGKTSNGLRESRQIIYVTDVHNKVFLSREACVSLGIISDQFPKVGEIARRTTTNVTSDAPEHPRNDIGLTADCSCPKRELPPPPPTQLPCPATDGNRETLRQFLFDPEATPFAYHTPIPVPPQWRADVKVGLDRDVLLGVIEPVPVGEPVTWCHRMVVCAKKDGKPRRTVDFQPLNKHATRETHHTQPPFHQARSVPQHDNIEFAGFEITPTSARPSRKFLESIPDFPTPANITDIRSWF